MIFSRGQMYTETLFLHTSGSRDAVERLPQEGLNLHLSAKPRRKIQDTHLQTKQYKSEHVSLVNKVPFTQRECKTHTLPGQRPTAKSRSRPNSSAAWSSVRHAVSPLQVARMTTTSGSATTKWSEVKGVEKHDTKSKMLRAE